MSTAVDPFGGPGGWDIAARELDIDVEGIELDHAACETRRAAGLRTIEADVANCNPQVWADVDGLIMSPPCQAFSSAGKGKGRDHVPALAAAIHRRDWSARPDPDPKVWLVLEVGRWYEAIRPEWVALEQVPAVLPLWEAYATILRADGYSVWCGLLCAADYGVPQTRTRAILIASRTRAAHPPAATHAERPQASLFGTLQPWVTMADALGWGLTERPAYTFAPGTGEGGGADMVGSSWVRERLRRERDEGRWVVATRGESGRAYDEFDGAAQPSRTITGKSDSWRINTNRGQGAYDTENGCQEVSSDRPAPTVTAKSGGQWTIRTTVEQALILQGFPADYPVQGTKTKQFEQIGNAIPPPLARAILGQLVDTKAAAA